MTSEDDNIEDVCDDIKDALSHRYTREVRVCDEGDKVLAFLGAQYGLDTAKGIAEDDVEPASPEGWRVDTIPKGVFGHDSCHIQVLSPEYLHHNRHLDAIAGSVNEMTRGGNGGDL